MSEPSTKPGYKKALDRRPWKVGNIAAEKLKPLLPTWLAERGGVIVYENHTLDSSDMWNTMFLPRKYLMEGDVLTDAPTVRWQGGLPSRWKEQVDFIELSEYDPEETTIQPDGHIRKRTPAEVAIEKAFIFEE